jgi:mono/diheme cytochrome c family protein
MLVAAAAAVGAEPDAPPAAVPDDAAAVITAEQIAAGASLYEMHCAMCHGEHMREPGGGYFNLRTFPADRKPRFVNSVTNGKNSMPPWRSVLSPEDIDKLWAYVIAGEKDG